ncbi:precorrin-3B synthase [Methylocystis sp. WRRC1]|uniref:precorrin-3B synthase n=1 Tax=Methylocystis sp. WRRC1 TaxID=1732014 RepID=UPI001D150E61|nr:precorrin-3B synthase [Methylocystis sp. WRRC1]MCC3247088.1 precorrin-3B synthase [Methylocystis sp. WRRC1]
MRPTPEIKGWCPGAHRPMASNDGLLIRAKIIGSRVTAAQLRAIAEIAADCGNGLVDLSQRAQLQIRGVSESTLAEALRRMDAQGLLAPDAEAERVTNIVASPLAGLDAAALFDANALAFELAEAARRDAALHALPAKFLFSVDDGGALSLADVAADIRIEAHDVAKVALFVAGADDRAVLVDRPDAVATALRMTRAFLALRGDRAFELRRMRYVVAARGLEALLREAGLKAQPCERRSHPQLAAAFGAQQTHGVNYAGAAAPFGRWRVDDLSTLAMLAIDEGVGEIRLTSLRALLVPTPSRQAAQRVVDAAHARGLVTSADDPRLAVVACPGAPECPQAQGETRNALALLAPLAQKFAGIHGVGLHVSGCAKGCAHPGRAPVTLVANGGLFDLVENGDASAAPRMAGLSIDDVERALTIRAKEQSCQTP